MNAQMKVQGNWQAFLGFAIRVIVVHMLTYFLFGILFSNLFDYKMFFRQDVIRDYMIPIAERNVWLGPFLQPVRGLVFAIGLWPLRGMLIGSKRGWLTLWGLLVTVGILSTPAAAPSSIEGMVYTRVPMWYHLLGLPEVVLQTLAFSIWLVWWERQAVTGHEPQTRQQDSMVSELVRAFMAACFAYIGYAIGGLLLVANANANAAATGADPINVETAGANLKMQFMFIVAFVVNVLAAFWLARKRRAGQMPLWTMFGLFWFIDAFVPWLYQTIVFGGSHIPTIIMLGLFPALIITVSVWMNYRNRAGGAGVAITKSS